MQRVTHEWHQFTIRMNVQKVMETFAKVREQRRVIIARGRRQPINHAQQATMLPNRLPINEIPTERPSTSTEKQAHLCMRMRFRLLTHFTINLQLKNPYKPSTIDTGV
jgi:hypothetical protein